MGGKQSTQKKFMQKQGELAHTAQKDPKLEFKPARYDDSSVHANYQNYFFNNVGYYTSLKY